MLVVDQLTKILAVEHLTDREPIKLLGGLVYLVLTRNTGAAFSLASGYTMVLSLLALGVIAVIIRFSRKLASRPWAVALGLILGGAGGNLLDRIFRDPAPLRGGVIDFISLFDDHGQVWPVFNVADSALMIGVVLAVILEFAGRRPDGTRASRSDA